MKKLVKIKDNENGKVLLFKGYILESHVVNLLKRYCKIYQNENTKILT